MVDKTDFAKEMADKAFFGRENGRYFHLHGRQTGSRYGGNYFRIWFRRHYCQVLYAPTYRVWLFGAQAVTGIVTIASTTLTTRYQCAMPDVRTCDVR